MSVRIYTRNADQPDFQFDIETDVEKTQRYNPTQRPVEDIGNVVDHVYRVPFTVSSNGLVAWTPVTPRTYQPTPSIDPNVMIDAQKALEELAAKRDLVNMVCDVFTGRVVITSLVFSKATDDGYSLRVAITLSEIEIATAQTTQVSPSRLRSKVRRRAASKKGQPATAQPTTAQKKKKIKSILAKGVDRGLIPGFFQ